MWATRATWMALAVTIVLLARGLPPETFFVGDPGVKLVAARAAIEHPSTPFDVSLPEIGRQPVPFVDPFFVIHGDHAHAVTSEAFPVLSAPFIALFGIRGAYVLPALGFLLAVWSCAQLAAAIGSPSSTATVMLTAALGTPLLFYGLEFWEHAPAVALAAIAATLLLKNSRVFLAGLLFGISILLRPEALWFFLAVVVSSRFLTTPPRWSVIGVAAAGMALAVAPLWMYSLLHFGTMAPPHMETQAELLTVAWLNTRATIVAAWFAPEALRATPLWGVVLGLTALSGFVVKGEPASGRKFLASVLLLDVALVVLTAPNDGGGQWGPRYLLFAFIPAAVLIADALHRINGRTTAGIAATILLLAAGAWIQRSGYRDLRGTKIIYGHVLDLVEQQVLAGGYGLTDIWWLDQVAAAATADRTILVAASEENRRDALKRLYNAGVPTVTAFISRDESADVSAWSRGPCYEAAGQTAIEPRNLVAITLNRLQECK